MNMSSVLIKGAKMPRCCDECNMEYNRILSPTDYCDVTDKDIENGTTRPSWCPLVEIPPHGRLIDAAEVMKSIKEDYCDSCQYKPTTCHDCHIGDVLFIIANAPTVIESEEEE